MVPTRLSKRRTLGKRNETFAMATPILVFIKFAGPYVITVFIISFLEMLSFFLSTSFYDSIEKDDQNSHTI